MSWGLPAGVAGKLGAVFGENEIHTDGDNLTAGLDPGMCEKVTMSP